MSLNFKIWFIDAGKRLSNETRYYIEEIDWVFHARNTIIAPLDVAKNVTDMRAKKIDFTDTIPDAVPKLECPCDL
jgi:hypothetical protein